MTLYEAYVIIRGMVYTGRLYRVCTWYHEYHIVDVDISVVRYQHVWSKWLTIRGLWLWVSTLFAFP